MYKPEWMSETVDCINTIFPTHTYIGLVGVRDNILSCLHSPRFAVNISISNVALTLNKWKDKISSFKLTGTFNTYIIYIQEVLTRIHKCVPGNNM